MAQDMAQAQAQQAMVAQQLQVFLKMDQESVAAFLELLRRNLAHDNIARKQAEELYNGLYDYHTEQCIALLTNAIRQSTEEQIRQIACVLLRKAIVKPTAEQQSWSNLSSQTQAYVKSELMQAVQNEQSLGVLKKVCSCISELFLMIESSQEIEEKWTQLLPVLFNYVSAQDERLNDAALMIFAEIGMYVVNQLKPHLDTLYQILESNLQKPNTELQMSALKSLTSFVQGLKEKADKEKFQALIPLVMQMLMKSLKNDEDEEARSILQLLTEIAEEDPRWLRKHLTEMTTLMLEIAEQSTLDAGVRQLSAEFLITLCEARDAPAGMMRRLPGFVEKMFSILMAWLLEITDQPEWHQADEDDGIDQGEGELYEPGQEYLDRLALSIGGKALLPVMGKLLMEWLADQKWEKRSAALICLAQVAEGCVKVMQQQDTLNQLVQMCVAGFKDSNARVQWAASQALGQMCTDLAPDIQEAHTDTIVNAFLHVLPDFSKPRVQTHVCAAIVNFCDRCEANELMQHADSLVEQLLKLLMGEQSKNMVREAALTALAQIADTIEDRFGRYYDTLVPILRDILVRANGREFRVMRSKALECISLVGLAVGVEKFRADAEEVMRFMQGLQGTTDPDDPVTSQMMLAGARVCKCLGKEFLPYLDTCMPQLLAAAAKEPSIRVRDLDEETEDDDDIEAIEMGDCRIEIRTSVLEEKATACTMLGCYVEALKEGFFPYLQQTTDLMLPLVKFMFNEEVRKAAMQCTPELFRCAVAAQRAGQFPANGQVEQLLKRLWEALLQGLEKEVRAKSEGLVTCLESISELVDEMEPGMLEMGQVTSCFKVLEEVAKSSSEERMRLAAREREEEYDEDEMEKMAEFKEWEEEVMEAVAVVLGMFLKKYGDSVYPLVDALFPLFSGLLQQGSSVEDKRIAICLVVDLAEYAPGPASQKYGRDIMAMLIGFANANEADLVQVACYGLGVVAQKLPDLFRGEASAIAKVLLDAITRGKSKQDFEMAVDNATASLGKIIGHGGYNDLVDVNFLTYWLSNLPIKNDIAEAPEQHKLLCSLLEAQDPRLIGASAPQMFNKQIFDVLTFVLSRGTQLIDAEGGLRAARLLVAMQQAVPEGYLESLVQSMKDHEKSNLQEYMSGQAPAAK